MCLLVFVQLGSLVSVDFQTISDREDRMLINVLLVPPYLLMIIDLMTIIHLTLHNVINVNRSYPFYFRESYF